MRSFRARIAVTSMVATGLAFVSFGFFAFWKIRNARLSHLDDDVKLVGLHAVGMSGGLSDSEMVASLLASHFGIDRLDSCIHMIRSNREGDHQGTGVIDRSDNWPSGLDTDSLHPGKNELDANAVSGLGPTSSPDEPIEGSEPPPGDLPERTGVHRQFEPRFSTVHHDGKHFRLGAFGDRQVIVLIGLDLDAFAGDLREIRRVFLWSVPAAGLLVALIGLVTSRRAIRPVRILRDKMENLSLRGSQERLDPANADLEFAPIIRTYNLMLERLERSYRQATRFSADASHELRTPLAVLRGTVEQALRRADKGSPGEQLCSQLFDEIDRVQRILDGLLLLSRADAGALSPSRERFDFSKWFAVRVEDADLLAEERGLRVDSQIEPGLRVTGDPVLLENAVHNILSNAVKYNVDGGRIRCRLLREGEQAVIRVANSGLPIPMEERETIFERFTRGSSQAEESHDTGLGIGLSLAREIVQAHGGSVRFTEDAEELTEVEIRLPIAGRGG